MGQRFITMTYEKTIQCHHRAKVDMKSLEYNIFTDDAVVLLSRISLTIQGSYLFH